MSGNTLPAEPTGFASLYRTGSVIAIALLAFVPIQVVVYLLSPPPATVSGFFELFARSPLLGLISLDLLYMADIVLAGLLLTVLCVALWRSNPSVVVLALMLNVVATATYFASAIAFEMLTLSGRYAAATTPAEQSAALGAGEAMLATYQGTAFNVSYVLASLGGLLVALVMLRSDLFERKVAYLGLVMNGLGLLPPTVGAVGMAAALLYLVPLMFWLWLIARRLWMMGKTPAASPQHPPLRVAPPPLRRPLPGS